MASYMGRTQSRFLDGGCIDFDGILTGVRTLENDDRPTKWNSAHVCPECAYPIDLEELGLRGSTTGLVTCPKCDRSGPIEIGVVSKDARD